MSGAAVESLGWSLVHFLWQGALVALVLEMALFALRERSARLRYALRCAALGGMGLLPLGTFLWLQRGAAAPPALPALPEQLEAMLDAAQAAGEGAAGAGWMGWLVAAWALGATACAARVLRDYARIRRLQSSAAGRPLPLDWQVRFERLARCMDVRAVVRVIDSAALAAPTVIGWLKPVVLVPARALTGLSAEQLEVVLIHELAHVRRHDYLVNLVQSALEALLFYHPAVWWVSHGIRAEREFCCDDAALSLSSDGVVYARALATLESWRNVQPELALSTLGGPLMTRIQRLIGIRPSSRPVRGPLAALGALLVIGTATAFANQPSDVQDPEQLRLMRRHLEEMQQRLDELRAMLDESVEQRDAPFGEPQAEESPSEGNVWFFGDDGGGFQVEVGPEFEWKSESDEESEGPHSLAWSVKTPGEGKLLVLRGGPRARQDADPDDEDECCTVRSEGAGSERGELTAKLEAYVHRQRAQADHDADRAREHAEQLRSHLGRLREEREDHHGLLQTLHEHLGRLHEGQGEYEVQRDHAQTLHDHLRSLFHEEEREDGDDDAGGEAEIEVIIKRSNEPEQHIHRRIPLNGRMFGVHPKGAGSANVELFFDSEGSGDVEVFALETDQNSWSGKGGQRFELRTHGDGDDDEGSHGFWFGKGNHGDGDREVRVLELKRRVEADRARADEHRQRIIELKQALGSGSEGAGHVLKLEPRTAPSGELELRVEVAPTILERKDKGEFPVRVRIQTGDETPCQVPCEEKGEAKETTKAREIV